MSQSINISFLGCSNSFGKPHSIPFGTDLTQTHVDQHWWTEWHFPSGRIIAWQWNHFRSKDNRSIGEKQTTVSFRWTNNFTMKQRVRVLKVILEQSTSLDEYIDRFSLASWKTNGLLCRLPMPRLPHRSSPRRYPKNGAIVSVVIHHPVRRIFSQQKRKSDSH